MTIAAAAFFCVYASQFYSAVSSLLMTCYLVKKATAHQVEAGTPQRGPRSPQFYGQRIIGVAH